MSSVSVAGNRLTVKVILLSNTTALAEISGPFGMPVLVLRACVFKTVCVEGMSTSLGVLGGRYYEL